MSLLSSLIKSVFELDSPETKGRIGEIRTVKMLQWMSFCGREGLILQNVYVPKSDGTTTEIDVLFITTKGFFVIESKNYAGYIFGDEKSSKWTVTLYAGKDWMGRKTVEKHQFYNPVWQNETHIRFLKQYVNEDIQTVSIIAFSDRCELKSIHIERPNLAVCNRSALPGLMRELWNEIPDTLSKEHVQELYERVLPLTNADKAVKQMHIQSIQNRFDSTEFCPVCGGKLILRTAKKGANAGNQFYGCSTYPNCKYTKNL